MPRSRRSSASIPARSLSACPGSSPGWARPAAPRRRPWPSAASRPWARADGFALMAIRARVDRHKCIGAGNCITLAPTAFDWLAGDYGKSDVVGPDTVDEEVLRAAAFSCPTAALGGAGEIVASAATAGESSRTSDPRSATLKGLSEPIEVVNVEWR